MIDNFAEKIREAFKRQLEKIPAKDKKILLIMLICVLVVTGAYIGVYLFTDRPSGIETEIAFSYVREETLKVTGFAVRDESYIEGSENKYILTQDTGKHYVPVIEDGENVGVRSIIAYAFDSESEASDYIEYKRINKELESLNALKSQIDLTGISVSQLNAAIFTTVNQYINAASDKNLSDLHDVENDFIYKSSTKQIAIGKEIDIDSKISELKATLGTLKANIGNHSNIVSQYSGHFTSVVDGYESIKSFDDVKNKNVTNGEGNKLIASTPQTVYDNTYGKIIADHDWYFIFDTNIYDANTFTTGGTVSVSFPEAGIEDVKMTVHYTSELVGDTLTVVLKSTRMTQEMANLRIEEAEIKTVDCQGIRISKEALVSNDEGVISVYVIRGRQTLLIPLTILYSGEDYVIAQSYTPYTVNENGEEVVDTAELEKYTGRKLKLYDKIIVKGANLEDGEVIG